jgi:F-type H+-transporting ATPase subunit gamma
MAGLKEIRNRITSIKSTQQITSAMKMVSASKLRRAQMSILKFRPYAQKFNEILNNLGSDIGTAAEGKYCEPGEINRVLIVSISSNRGLCGSFNANIIRTTQKLEAGSRKHENQTSNIQLPTSNISLICIGRKVNDYFSKRKYNVIENYSSIFESLTYDNAAKIAEKLISLYLNRDYDKIMIVYNKFKNAAMQQTTTEQFLPLQIEKTEKSTVDRRPSTDFIFEPSQGEILSHIIPNYLKMNLYRMLLESNASEHGARMTAMHIATDNAADILKQLSLSYNKARQATITKELLEIVSGAEALK